MISTKKWLVGFTMIQIFALIFAIILVVTIDPFFHYHKPNPKFFYPLNSQRSQNDGIEKHFSYDGMITGTSMTENFKVSEANAIFDKKFIKTPFSGGSYKEMDENIRTALKHSSDLSIVIRCLDMGAFFDDKDHMRFDMGEYPTYLYNDNLFDDINYVANKDIILSRCLPIIQAYRNGQAGGVTSFDIYSNWNAYYTFGKDTVLAEHAEYREPTKEQVLTDEDKAIIRGNIEQNVVSTAKAYPNVDFYYFFSPYSAAWWGDVMQGGDLDSEGYLGGNLNRQIDAEQYIIEMILEYPNIHLFSFNDRYDITTDLDNYKDTVHYGEWVNSWMLSYMKSNIGLLTKENFRSYLDNERKFYQEFNYNSLFDEK